MDSKKIDKAKKYSAEKHKEQKRKFSGKPYFTHPSNVASMVAKYTKDEEIIMAAYLHDTIEDTATTYKEIFKEFGKKVAELVGELTSDKSKYSKSTKSLYLLKKMNNMSDEALLIKLCDRLDNISGYPDEPNNFVKLYMKQTKYILSNLKRNLNSNHKELILKIQEILEEIQHKFN
ncbi:MAG: HD domain-containing protein [Candidatus Hodarchaeota archaeon]